MFSNKSYLKKEEEGQNQSDGVLSSQVTAAWDGAWLLFHLPNHGKWGINSLFSFACSCSFCSIY